MRSASSNCLKKAACNTGSSPRQYSEQSLSTRHTLVVPVDVTHPQLFGMFFDPYVCPDTHTLVVGASERLSGIHDPKMVSELLHYLMATSLGPGSGEWYGRLCAHGRDRSSDRDDAAAAPEAGR